MLNGLQKLIDDLKTSRDEISLRIHLGSKDLQDNWADLEKRWHRFESSAQLEKTAQGLSEATKLLAGELKDGYDRLRKAL